MRNKENIGHIVERKRKMTNLLQTFKIFLKERKKHKSESLFLISN